MDENTILPLVNGSQQPLLSSPLSLNIYFISQHHLLSLCWCHGVARSEAARDAAQTRVVLRAHEQSAMRCVVAGRALRGQA